MEPWHERDEFWLTMAPLMFGPARWAAAAAEIERIVALLGLTPGAPILDLCCGPGRHALELARRGYAVVGVDRTAGYLERAAAGAASEGLNAEFVEEDMRRFCRPDSFQAALNLFTSFGYFEDPRDDRLVLQNVFRSLMPGGKVLIDLKGKEVVARHFRERDWREEDGVTFLEERRLAQDWGWIDCRWILLNGKERHEFTLSHRLYSAAELGALLRECGFRDIRMYGDLAAAPYDHEAERLIAVAEKARA